MSEFTTRQQALISSLRSRDEIAHNLFMDRAQLRQVQKDLAALSRGGADPQTTVTQIQRLQQWQAEVKAQMDKDIGSYTSQAQIVQDRQQALAALGCPQTLVEELNDKTPFLLFPVRIETKFMKPGPEQHELWVRIFPDDVTVESHEELLTQTEIAAAKAYWKARWQAGTDEAAVRAAWRVLVGGFGQYRAAWLVKRLTPLNWAPDEPSKPDAVGDATSSPQFPHLSEEAANVESWSHPPQARSLPDRFVVMAYTNADDKTPVHTVLGELISDPLPLGPDPAGMTAEESSSPWTRDTQWLTDFDAAVSKGMAVRIGLTADEAQKGFARLLVLGVRLASDLVDGQARLERLLASHQYTTGLSLIPQGTPTNNTANAQAGYTSSDLDADASFDVVHGKVAEVGAQNPARCDGQRLAQALGISFDSLQGVAHLGNTDAWEAIAMNQALWPATLGYFIDEMLQPYFCGILDDLGKPWDLQLLRNFFVEYVSGRGWLPALRFGHQPYGILPTTVFSRFTRMTSGVPKLDQLLQSLYQAWTDLGQRVSHLGPNQEPSKTLINILGLHPSSVEFYSRHFIGLHTMLHHYQFPFQREGREHVAKICSPLRNLLAEPYIWECRGDKWELDSIAEPGRVVGMIVSGEITSYMAGDMHPRIATGVFLDYQAKLSTLVDNTLSEERTLVSNYIHGLINATIAKLRDETFNPPQPTSLLQLLLSHALLLQYWNAAVEILKATDHYANLRWDEFELINMVKELEKWPLWSPINRSDLTRWDFFAIKVFENSDDPEMMLPLSESLEQVVQTGSRDPVGWTHYTEVDNLVELASALRTLAKLPTARLERLLTEHLDLCSYRLDAWQLSFINSRLEWQRVRRLEDKIYTYPGIYLGAYGWLEEVRPSQQKNGGYIHAPSLTHATTAALLRNAYLTHASPENPNLMAVDLSSARVRRALWYLEGVRNGQELGALLGYTLARGLHERDPKLNRHLPALRRQFPLVAGRVIQSPAGEPIEALEARNVVDGLALVQAVQKGIDFPYGAAELKTDEADKNAIQAVVAQLQADLDAISDLTLSEGVYQMAQGNYDRAGAVLNALGEGGRIDERLEVVRSPRGGNVVTHRLMLNFFTAQPAANPWPSLSLSPRAQSEPYLNHWLGNLLGDPTQVRCYAQYKAPNQNEQTVEVSLADLNLQPLDFLTLCSDNLGAGATELEQRLRYHLRAIYALPDSTEIQLHFVERLATWPLTIKTFTEILPLGQRLQALFGGSRALKPNDFTLASDRHVNDQPDAAELWQRLNRAWSIAKAIEQQLATATTPAQQRAALLAAAQLGIPDAIPTSASDDAPEAVAALQAQVSAVLAEVRKRLPSAAQPAPAVSPQNPTLSVSQMVAALQTLFGRSYPVLPQFSLTNSAELQGALEQQGTLVSEEPLIMEEWLQELTPVRPKVANYQTAMLLADTCQPGCVSALQAVQLPLGVTGLWQGLPSLAGQRYRGDSVALVMHTAAGYHPAGPQAGLLLDEWNEIIPNAEEVTGIAYHYNQPNSEPPQALLLVVPPEIKGKWLWQDLVDTLTETLDLAKKRAVEPDQIDKTPYAQLLPAIMLPFTTSKATIAVDLRTSQRIV